ncbi:MAG: hypothetical protein FWG64_04990 [Firmicutes bacterium]|nr:hypothetical protein [Bacillota bacterium]
MDKEKEIFFLEGWDSGTELLDRILESSRKEKEYFEIDEKTEKNAIL